MSLPAVKGSTSPKTRRYIKPLGGEGRGSSGRTLSAHEAASFTHCSGGFFSYLLVGHIYLTLMKWLLPILVTTAQDSAPTGTVCAETVSSVAQNFGALAPVKRNRRLQNISKVSILSVRQIQKFLFGDWISTR